MPSCSQQTLLILTGITTILVCIINLNLLRAHHIHIISGHDANNNYVLSHLQKEVRTRKGTGKRMQHHYATIGKSHDAVSKKSEPLYQSTNTWSKNAAADKNPYDKMTSCGHLMNHMQGNWKHHLAFPNNITELILFDPSIQHDLLPLANDLLNDETIRRMYLAQEMDWLHGRGLPENPLPPHVAIPKDFKIWGFGKKKCRNTPNNNVDRGISYVSTLGHQCGCGTTTFQPSHSYWLYDSGKNAVGDRHHAIGHGTDLFDSASLRLARLFAKNNATVCFAGDSVDNHFYYGLKNNLYRANRLHMEHFNKTIVNITEYQYPVHYSSNLTSSHPRSTGYRLPDGSYRLATSIRETVVSFHDEPSLQSTFKYLQHFRWAPWLYEYMESCNVMIMNQGLHYGLDTDELFLDTQAAITFLTNFSASDENRIAIWREAVPQHFDTLDGHYRKHLGDESTHCATLKDKYSNKSEIQEYMRTHNRAFSKLCNHDSKPCGQLQHTCTVNTKSTDLFTIYWYWMRNNLTAELDQVEYVQPNVTGTILMWPLFDLFDVPMWHADNFDCTHFCYVPALYDAAFGRLELLLSEFM